MSTLKNSCPPKAVDLSQPRTLDKLVRLGFSMCGKTAHPLVARALLKRFSVTLVPKTWPRSSVSIEEQLLNYLNKHPEAKDTLEGIMMWWLSATDPDEARSELDDLVARGLVCAECGPDGRIYYCRAGKGSKLQEQIAADGDGKIE